MRIEELSIGDWVLCDGEYWKISAINEDSVGLRCDSDYSDAFLEECDPIPLTPEILEKNGIIKTYEDDEYAVYKGEGFNVTEYYTELWEFSARRNRIMLKNVHELQHASAWLA